MHYNLSMKFAKENPDRLYTGCIIKESTSDEQIYYEVIKTKPFPILKERERSKIPNEVGDYVLNMRTGYISIIGNDYNITDPINNKRLNDIALSALQKEYLP